MNTPTKRSLLAVAVCLSLVLCVSFVWAQSPNTDWEKAAGGKMSFEVASVKENSGPKTEIANEALGMPAGVRPFSNFPLNNSDVYPPNGGLFSATNQPLLIYIGFAYKLGPVQTASVMSQLPKWADEERFDIQARAARNVSKDQMRLMMQSLLADRFRLAIHWEPKQVAVYALVLAKSGKIGPQLSVHPKDAPCSTVMPVPVLRVRLQAGYRQRVVESKCFSQALKIGSVMAREM